MGYIDRWGKVAASTCAVKEKRMGKRIKQKRMGSVQNKVRN